ncbi:MAG TPA: helix-turn-helix domain-containing protein [Acidimicrobiales bacterium]|jgi:DNA-binding transcriptional MerR regulator
MFGISTVAKLAGVSTRTLRYYDELGLLRPVWVDPVTGYRWYEPGQLHRLHRILALRDLGVRLAEIALLLDESLTAEELRGILLLRRAEAHDRLAAEAERLARVEARLAQMEVTTVPEYDVVVKDVEAEWVLAMHEELGGVSEIEAAHDRMWPRLHAKLEELGVERVPPSIAVERGDGPIELTCALPVPEGVRYEDDTFATLELPALPRVATTVMRGLPDFEAAYAHLRAWTTEAGEALGPQSREVYLDCDGPRATWVVEIQFELADRIG